MRHILQNLALTLICTASCNAMLAQDTFTVEDGAGVTLTYTISGENTVGLKSAVASIEGTTVNVPGSVQNDGVDYDVTTINALAFSSNTNIKNIVIGSNVTWIEGGAIAACDALEVVCLPSSITRLADAWLQSSPNLKFLVVDNADAYNIPTSSWTFYYLPYSTCTLIVPTGASASYRGASGWTNFPNIIESSMTSMGLAALPLTFSAENAEGITLSYMSTDGATVTVTGVSALTELTDLVIPATVSYDGSEYTVTAIGKSVFANQTYLQSIDMPDTITLIDREAFSGCTALQSADLPEGLVTLAERAFYQCTQLSSVVLPAGLVALSDYCFYYCTNITEVEIPGTVESIGYYAFAYCSNLETVQIDPGVKTISSHVFDSCTKLKSVCIPSTVTTLDAEFTFANGRNLKSFIVDRATPWDLGYYSYSFFSGSDLSNCTLYVPVGSKEAYSSASPWNSISNIEESELVSEGLAAVPLEFDIEIAEGVTMRFETVGINKVKVINLSDPSTPTSITIPQTVTYEGQDYTVTRIGKLALANLTNLTSVVMPETVTAIDDNAFQTISSLTSITLSDALTSIGSQAFWCCSNLEAIDLPSTLVSIGEYAFYGCLALKSIHIPAGVEDINSYTFNGCANLKTVVIDEGVKSIGAEAFRDCNNLEEIYLPSTVTQIDGSYPLGSSMKLKLLAVRAEMPISVSYSTLSSFYSATLYVPIGSKEAYAGASYWSTLNIEEANIVVPDIESANIVDGYAYISGAEAESVDVRYTRTFTHDGWQALYVPFDIDYEDWSADGTVARLVGVEGTAEEPVLVWEKILSGKVDANTPCIFRPATEGDMTLLVSDATLAVSPKVDTMESIVADHGYTYNVCGNYKSKTDMQTTGAYALAAGHFHPAQSDDVVLKPMRIYLTIDSGVNQVRRVRVKIDDEEINGIEDIYIESNDGVYYDLNGRRVLESANGIFISNGNKIFK